MLSGVLTAILTESQPVDVRLRSGSCRGLPQSLTGLESVSAFFCKKMRNIWKISLYLSHALFLLRNLRKRIKRESGANPGQSRCCKLQNGLGNSFMPLTRVGKALIPEVSQKTCNAYFFDGFEDRPEENCEAVGFCLSLFPFPVAIYLFLIILP